MTVTKRCFRWASKWRPSVEEWPGVDPRPAPDDADERGSPLPNGFLGALTRPRAPTPGAVTKRCFTAQSAPRTVTKRCYRWTCRAVTAVFLTAVSAYHRYQTGFQR